MYLSWQQYVVEHPMLVQQNRTLDFGNGLYTTTNKMQALNLAKKLIEGKLAKLQ